VAELSEAALRVLVRAVRREPPHYVCPTPGLYAAAQTAVLLRLRAGGYITADSCPALTDKGVQAAFGVAAAAHAKAAQQGRSNQ
jgi:hypothetical protein